MFGLPAVKTALLLALSWSLCAQPAVETIDLAAITRIRDEGINHSHIMDYASGLFDGIGPRLTASPDFVKAEEWSLQQLRRMGASNAHTESWGEFGMGWQQIGTSVQMTAPSTATVLAQATPWSPATSGEVTAEIISVPTLKEEKDFDKWKGKLTRKIILYGDDPKVNPNPANPLQHYDPASLEHLHTFPLDGDQGESHVLRQDAMDKFFKESAFQEKVGHFFTDEHAVAVLRAGGSGGLLHDDTGMTFGWFVYQPEHKQTIPSAVIASESFGRMYRLASHSVPVSVRLNIATKFSGEHEPGSNVIAEIPGSDPVLKRSDRHARRSPGQLDRRDRRHGRRRGKPSRQLWKPCAFSAPLDLQPCRYALESPYGAAKSKEFSARPGTSAATSEHALTPPNRKDKSSRNSSGNRLAPSPSSPSMPSWTPTSTPITEPVSSSAIFAEGNPHAVAAIFQQWAAPISDLGFTAVTLRNAGSTDHVSFDQVGLPGFQFIQDPRDYETRSAHTSLDTYERLSEPDLKQAAVIMATSILQHRAVRDAMLPRKTAAPPRTGRATRQAARRRFPQCRKAVNSLRTKFVPARTYLHEIPETRPSAVRAIPHVHLHRANHVSARHRG